MSRTDHLLYRTASNWRQVEVGRVVLFYSGPYAGRTAAIVQIIDHKRVRTAQIPNEKRRIWKWQLGRRENSGLTPLQVLVDGPSSKAELAVARHATPLSAVSLTNIVIPKLPRAAGSAALKKQWDAAGVDEKWTGSSYAKKMEKASRRKKLNDFERFKVMRLRKQVRFGLGHMGKVAWIYGQIKAV